jgi:hypothetical protein
MSNVIKFPGEKRGSPPQSLEDIVKSVENVRLEHCNGIFETLIPVLIDSFESMDMDIMSGQHMNQSGLFFESLKSLIYVFNDISHPLQPVADKLITSEANEHLFGYILNTIDDEQEEDES